MTESDGRIRFGAFVRDIKLSVDRPQVRFHAVITEGKRVEQGVLPPVVVVRESVIMDLMIDYPRQRVVDVGFDHLKIALAVFPAAAGDGDLVILDPDNGKRAITVLVGPGVIDLINRIATIVLYAWDMRMADQECGDVILVEQIE